MAELLDVAIVTPESEAFSGQAAEVVVPGWEGQFDVLPGHDIVLSLLRSGIATVVTPGGTHRFVVGRGFAEAGPERVVLLVDSCETPDQVDKTAAEAELAQAEEELQDAGSSPEEWDLVQARRELALARLEA